MTLNISDITNNMENMFEEDLISLAEVKTWDTEALKDFCRKRGYKVSGTRDELSARVYFLYNNKVPEEPGAKEKEASQKADYKALLRAGPAVTTDPAKFSKWIGEKEGMNKWPPISYVDITQFVTSKGCRFASATLESYKTGKGFAYFYNDWLQEVFYHHINKDSPVCYLKTVCTPSNRLSDDPHSLWIKVNKKTGTIYSAYCTCVAG